MKRSKFLRGASLVGLPFLTYAGFVEPTKLNLRKRSLSISQLSPVFDGFRIAHLTDFHFREGWDNNLIENAVRQTMEFKPHLIALTGDFIERSPKSLNAPLGVHAVPGNHDYYGFTPTELKDVFSGGNISLLINQVTDHSFREDHEVQVIGLDSASASKPKYNMDVPSNPHQLKLLLAHEPDVFDKTSQCYKPHLQLSGHTHGGQCRVPFTKTAPFTPYYGRKYVDGHFTKDNSHLFVSSGLGTAGLRVRFACKPEVVLLTLKTDPPEPTLQ